MPRRPFKAFFQSGRNPKAEVNTLAGLGLTSGTTRRTSEALPYWRGFMKVNDTDSGTPERLTCTVPEAAKKLGIGRNSAYRGI
jgi:hypothetical protein